MSSPAGIGSEFVSECDSCRYNQGPEIKQGHMEISKKVKVKKDQVGISTAKHVSEVCGDIGSQIVAVFVIL